MRLTDPESSPASTLETSADGVDHDAIETMLSDYVVSRESHRNAEGIVIRPDTVQDVLSRLRTEVGFDHLSCVTAQEYEDRYECIYHLKKY
jgi:NADH-quinone oxidoreductase subunit C/D